MIKNILIYILLLISISIFPEAPAEKNEEKKEEQKLRKWAYVYSNSLEKFTPNYIKKIQSNFDVICVTGLLLRGTGQLRFQNELINKLDKAKVVYNSKGKETGAEIVPMVAFSSNKDGINLLKNENARLKSIENLKIFLKANGFKTIHLDFEGLTEDYAKLLANYLKELKENFSKEELKVTFAIFPQVDFSDLKKFHKPELIAPHVDEVVLMSYDYHNIKTKAGCVTSYIWSEKNLEELIKHFPANKIWLGVPAYGYEWFIESKRVNVISAKEADLLLPQYMNSREASGCIKIIKKEKGKESIIYYADSETRKYLVNPARNFSIAGTALWRLGLEED
jgi:spore germination protein YaaH